VRHAIAEVITANALESGYLRLLVYPAGNCTRLDPAAHSSEILVVGWRVDGPRFAPPLSLGIADVRRPPASTFLPRAKHSGLYGVYAASHSIARAAGHDDALVLHADGSICEVTGANIFLVKGRTLLTPLIPDSIDGITRRLVMAIAAEEGLDVREARIMPEQLGEADEIFITGTFHGIRAVSSVGAWRPRAEAPGPVTLALRGRIETRLDSAGADPWLTTVAPPLAATNGIAASGASFKVRPAGHDDMPAVLEGVRLLLEELRGTPGTKLPAGAELACRRLIDGKARGGLFVATPAAARNGAAGADELLGLLSLSVLEAIHFGGPYALIQDLWVRPDHRSDGVGAALIAAAEGYCREHRLANMEVCLPSHRFPRLPRTHRFYQECGFVELGPRMRKEVA
jgi:branched-chain amino acid aminotransferase